MSCKGKTDHIQTLLFQKMEDRAKKDILDHIKVCTSCQKDYHQAKLTADLLQADRQKLAPLPEEFALSLHNRLVRDSQAQNTAQTRLKNLPILGWLKPLYALAAVFILALGMVLGLYLGSTPGLHQAEVVATAHIVPLDRPLKMTLNFESSKEIEEVTFSIKLPYGVMFETDDEKIALSTRLEWQGRLEEGKNQIPLALRALEKGTWKIIASARAGELVHTHEIILQVEG